MVSVPLERIVPLTEARSRISEIVDQSVSDRFWVIAKGGKPRVAVVDIQFFSELMRRAWFDNLAADSHGAWRDYLTARGIDPQTLSEDEAEKMIEELAQ